MLGYGQKFSAGLEFPAWPGLERGKMSSPLFNVEIRGGNGIQMSGIREST